MTIWSIQEKGGTCCFPHAVINCLIYCSLPVPHIITLEKVAKCENGNSINLFEVIEKAKAPLLITENPDNVYNNGGILTILHPIFNGHSFFIYPSKKNKIIAVNSWLGPPVSEFSMEEIKPYIWKTHKHWELSCSFIL